MKLFKFDPLDPSKILVKLLEMAKNDQNLTFFRIFFTALLFEIMSQLIFKFYRNRSGFKFQSINKNFIISRKIFLEKIKKMWGRLRSQETVILSRKLPRISQNWPINGVTWPQMTLFWFFWNDLIKSFNFSTILGMLWSFWNLTPQTHTEFS